MDSLVVPDVLCNGRMPAKPPSSRGAVKHEAMHKVLAKQGAPCGPRHPAQDLLPHSKSEDPLTSVRCENAVFSPSS